MATGNDLMGLGLPPMISMIIAEAGTGPAALAVAGSSYATSTKIKVGQSLVTVAAGGGGGAAGTSGIGLPVVGGATGVLLGDLQIVACTGTDTLSIYGSTGVLICGSGGNTSFINVPVGTTMMLFPASASQWVAVKGA